MKLSKWFLGLVGILVFVFSLRAEEGLVLHLAFDEEELTVEDLSGKGNNGTLIGNPQWAKGLSGKALHLNGKPFNYVDCGSDVSLQLSIAFTIEAWIYREIDSGTWEPLVAKSDDITYDYALQIANDDKLSFAFIGTPGVCHVRGEAKVPLNQWVHAAVTFDGEYLRLYFNGHLDKTSEAYPGAVRQTDRHLWIGKLKSYSHFNGIIEEVKILNLSLSAEAIKNSYDHVINLPWVSATSEEVPAIATIPKLEAVTFEQPPEAKKLGLPPITYIVYIMKENQSYDAFFGDLGRGDGEPRFCRYPRCYTPKQHQYADQFALCDNYFSEGRASAQNHWWSVAGTTNDYTEDYVMKVDYQQWMSEKTLPKTGTIFGQCSKYNISYHIYGGPFPRGPFPLIPPDHITWHWDPLPHAVQLSPPTRTLEGKLDHAAASAFIYDLQHKGLRQFTYFNLYGDHELATPAESDCGVMENDAATGRIVDAVMESPYWKNSVIFIVQDEAGYADHIDKVYRVPALVISPFAKKGYISSEKYSHCSMLKTVQLLFGLPPLTEDNAKATLMLDCFELQK